ncbi:hypothetical protein Cfor_00536 [Coptotermes formosanus]|uniref:GIY-YIG domain-containing protein n=1 Tax=Coptotermes formosanus TaxID=36987 RepID=A0A6L2PHG3_COPFO|nr:hypothetical protein Cfor_00536 [Coptotermes formosanus]
MNSLPLSNTRKQREWKTIKQIARANGLPRNILLSLRTCIEKQQKELIRTKDSHKKWIILTYFGTGTRSISNPFRQENLQIAYRTTGSIHNLLRGQTQHNYSEYENSGIYSLKCATCQLEYVGQTERRLQLRYNEHASYIRTNNPPSVFLNTYSQGHECGPIQEFVSLRHPATKEKAWTL